MREAVVRPELAGIRLEAPEGLLQPPPGAVPEPECPPAGTELEGAPAGVVILVEEPDAPLGDVATDGVDERRRRQPDARLVEAEGDRPVDDLGLLGQHRYREAGHPLGGHARAGGDLRHAPARSEPVLELAGRERAGRCEVALGPCGGDVGGEHPLAQHPPAVDPGERIRTVLIGVTTLGGATEETAMPLHLGDRSAERVVEGHHKGGSGRCRPRGEEQPVPLLGAPHQVELLHAAPCSCAPTVGPTDGRR